MTKKEALKVFNLCIEAAEAQMECNFKDLCNNLPVHGAFKLIREALQEPDEMVDIESLKKKAGEWQSSKAELKMLGYNQAIDDLKAKGYLRQPLEPIAGLEDVIAHLDSLPDIGAGE